MRTADLIDYTDFPDWVVHKIYLQFLHIIF